MLITLGKTVGVLFSYWQNWQSLLWLPYCMKCLWGFCCHNKSNDMEAINENDVLKESIIMMEGKLA